MKKSDLVYGNVVELRNGNKYLYHHTTGDKLLNLITGDSYTGLYVFNEDLTNCCKIFDIVKVYKDYTCKELLWERKEKPQLNEDEKVVLRNIDKDYKWIARDEDRTLGFHSVKPHKEAYFWSSLEASYVSDLFPNLFQFIKWEDDEPYSIEDLLKEEENDF